MAICAQCRTESPTGSRWCSICHGNLINPQVGRLASPGRRLAAYFADFVIPLVALGVGLGVVGAGAATQTDAGVGVGALLAFGAFVTYVVWALKLFANGATPGKKMLGMRVVREDGRHAGFGAMLVREWLGKWISGLLFGLGYFWLLWDRDRQGLHDKLLATYVVETAPAPAPVMNV